MAEAMDAAQPGEAAFPRLACPRRQTRGQPPAKFIRPGGFAWRSADAVPASLAAAPRWDAHGAG